MDKARRRERAVVLLAGYRHAGKSLLLQHLEQAGYVCVDNLPPRLVPGYLEHRKGRGSPGPERFAIALDIEATGGAGPGADEVSAAVETRDGLAGKGLACRLAFLEASESSLRDRAAAIAPPGDEAAGRARRAEERDAFAPLRAAADLVLDSSWASPAELRDRVIALAEGAPRSVTTLVEVSSFGFKYGAPQGDIVLDLRFIPNPYYVAALRPLTGRDPDCAAYVLADESARVALGALAELAAAMAPAYARQGRPALRIRLGCTGGRHRSVAMAEALGSALAERGLEVRVAHRDIGAMGDAAAAGAS